MGILLWEEVMSNNKKQPSDHIINGILASPLAFLMGGPAGVVSTLGLAKALEVLEEIEQEKKRENWVDPVKKMPETLEEVQVAIKEREQIRNTMLSAKDEIKEIMKNSYEMSGRYKSKGLFVSIYNQGVAACTLNGKLSTIEFCKDGNIIPFKEVPAYFYGTYEGYLKRLKDDLQRNPDTILYTLKACTYGSWMHTSDKGETYVVMYM